jgi:hypothetical protein
VIWMGVFWACRRLVDPMVRRANGRRVRRLIMSEDFLSRRGVRF